MAVTDLIVVVDENDVPIGNETIRQVREKGLIHRLARVMVEDSKGNILLQKRTGKLLWPHCWDNSAAGHVDAGEDYLAAAKRELFEEIGIEADKLEDIDTYFTDTTYGHNLLKRFNRLYRYVTDKTPTKLQADEVSEVKWFTLAEVKKLIKDHPDKVTDGLRDAIDRYY